MLTIPAVIANLRISETWAKRSTNEIYKSHGILLIILLLIISIFYFLYNLKSSRKLNVS